MNWDEVDFEDVFVSREMFFSIGTEKNSGKRYLSIPVSTGRVDYSEYYELDEVEFERFVENPSTADEFAWRCRRQELDDRLIVPAFGNRGTAIQWSMKLVPGQAKACVGSASVCDGGGVIVDEMESKIRSIFTNAVRAGMRVDQMGGAYQDDIDAFAAEQGAPAVPAAVRSVFALIGIKPGLYGLAAGAIGPGGIYPRDKALVLELLDELTPQSEALGDPQRLLIISTHEHESFAIIDGSDLSNPNPPVWFLQGNYHLEMRWRSVTEWFSVVTNDVLLILRS